MADPRPPRVITIDLKDGKGTALGVERSEMGHLVADGWTWAGTWVGVEQDGPTGAIIDHNLHVAMFPPGPLATLEQAERVALVSLVESNQAAHTAHLPLLQLQADHAMVHTQGLAKLLTEATERGEQLGGLSELLPALASAQRLDADTHTETLRTAIDLAGGRPNTTLAVLVRVGFALQLTLLIQCVLLVWIASLLATP